jgi:hypothetical protein
MQIGFETIREILEHRLHQDDIERLLEGLDETGKAELFYRITEMLRRTTALADIANRVNDSLSLDVLFPRLMEVVTEALNADRSTLFLHDPGNRRAVLPRAAGRHHRRDPFPQPTRGCRFGVQQRRRRDHRRRLCRCPLQPGGRPQDRLSHAQHPLRADPQQEARGDRCHPGTEQALRRLRRRGPAPARRPLAAGLGCPGERPPVREGRAPAARGGDAARSQHFHRFRDPPRSAAGKDHGSGDHATQR